MGSEQDARTTRILLLLTLRLKCRTAYLFLPQDVETLHATSLPNDAS